MSASKVLLIVLGVIVVGALLLGGCAYSGYGKAVDLDENVSRLWKDVDVQLQRRYELIPNAVAVVKGIAGQEKDIFLGVAEARKAYFQAETVNEKARAARATESALSRLLALRETYPELKSNQAFLKLQDQVEGTENRIGVARRDYNGAVEDLNKFVRKPISGFFARLADVEKAEYFEVDEAARTAPDIDFSDNEAPVEDLSPGKGEAPPEDVDYPAGKGKGKGE